MPCIYHLLPAAAWDPRETGPYRASSLASEGFIHCSHADQVARVANRFYADQPALLVLAIDADRLTSPLRDEEVSPGQRFPHVYGPIDREAILEVQPLARSAEGRWIFPAAPA